MPFLLFFTESSWGISQRPLSATFTLTPLHVLVASYTFASVTFTSAACLKPYLALDGSKIGNLVVKFRSAVLTKVQKLSNISQKHPEYIKGDF